MEEEHHFIDCFDYTDKSWHYINEGGEIDTRLIVMHSNDKDFVLRPPSLSNKRRFCISTDYREVKNNFNSLTEELKVFDFGIPNYNFILSDIHTKEGTKGEGLCLVSEYIVGRCLPLDLQHCWDENKTNFYIQMDKWLMNITNYSICKYLSAEENSLFLSDVFRPVQFAYACEEDKIYLVDLDPFFDKTLDKNGKVNKRLLIGLRTIDRQRNYYFNKMIGDGVHIKDWGKQSRTSMKKLFENTDFMKDTVHSPETEQIMKNLQQGIYYKKFD